MERGPMALFGAIVAVGLGPAMWLGAQFGAMTVAPSRPPAVSSEQANQAPAQQKGGSAGSAPDDPSVVLETKPRANYRPLNSRRSPSPSASSSATARPDPDESTTKPTEATSSPSPSAEPSTPPTESTSEPADDPSTAPPSPPPSDTETANPA
jgi:hypothetical protein